nr:hypothetical protein CFP56_48789 [Quercus suber]
MNEREYDTEIPVSRSNEILRERRHRREFLDEPPDRIGDPPEYHERGRGYIRRSDVGGLGVGRGTYASSRRHTGVMDAVSRDDGRRSARKYVWTILRMTTKDEARKYVWTLSRTTTTDGSQEICIVEAEGMWIKHYNDERTHFVHKP